MDHAILSEGSCRDAILDALDHVLAVHRQKIKELEDQLERERTQHSDKLQQEQANSRHHIRLKDETIACLRKQLSASLRRAKNAIPGLGIHGSWTPTQPLDPSLRHWRHMYDYPHYSRSSSTSTPTPHGQVRRTTSCDNNVLCSIRDGQGGLPPSDGCTLSRVNARPFATPPGAAAGPNAAVCHRLSDSSPPRSTPGYTPYTEMTGKKPGANADVHPKVTLAISPQAPGGGERTHDPLAATLSFAEPDCSPVPSGHDSGGGSTGPDYAVLLRQTPLMKSADSDTALRLSQAEVAGMAADAVSLSPVSGHVASSASGGTAPLACPPRHLARAPATASPAHSPEDTLHGAARPQPLLRAGSDDPCDLHGNDTVHIQSLLQSIRRHGNKTAPTEELVASSRALSAGACSLHSVLLHSAQLAANGGGGGSGSALVKSAACIDSGTAARLLRSKHDEAARLASAENLTSHYYSTICSVASASPLKDADATADPFLGSSSDLRHRCEGVFVVDDTDMLGQAAKAPKSCSQESLLVCLSQSPFNVPVTGLSCQSASLDSKLASLAPLSRLRSHSAAAQLLIGRPPPGSAATNKESSGDTPYTSAEESSPPSDTVASQSVLMPAASPAAARRKHRPRAATFANRQNYDLSKGVVAADAAGGGDGLSPYHHVLLNDVPETEFDDEDRGDGGTGGNDDEHDDSHRLLGAGRQATHWCTPSSACCTAPFIIPETLNIGGSDAPGSQLLTSHQQHQRKTHSLPSCASPVLDSPLFDGSQDTFATTMRKDASAAMGLSDTSLSQSTDESTPPKMPRRRPTTSQTTTLSSYEASDGDDTAESLALPRRLRSVSSEGSRSSKDVSPPPVARRLPGDHSTRARLQRPAGSKAGGGGVELRQRQQQQRAASSSSHGPSCEPAQRSSLSTSSAQSHEASFTDDEVLDGEDEADVRKCRSTEEALYMRVVSTRAQPKRRSLTSPGPASSPSARDAGGEWCFVPIPPSDSQLSLDLSAPFPQSPELKTRPGLIALAETVTSSPPSNGPLQDGTMTLLPRSDSYPTILSARGRLSDGLRAHSVSAKSRNVTVGETPSPGGDEDGVCFEMFDGNRSGAQSASKLASKDSSDSNWLKRGIDVTKRTTDRWLSRTAAAAGASPHASRKSMKKSMPPIGAGIPRLRGLHPGINVVPTAAGGGGGEAASTATKQTTLFDQHYFQQKKTQTELSKPRSHGKKGSRTDMDRALESTQSDLSFTAVCSTPIRDPTNLPRKRKSESGSEALRRLASVPLSQQFSIDSPVATERAEAVCTVSPRKAHHRPPLVKRTAVTTMDPGLVNTATSGGCKGEIPSALPGAAANQDQSCVNGDSTWFDMSPAQQCVDVSTTDRNPSPTGRRGCVQGEPDIVLEPDDDDDDDDDDDASSAGNSYNLLAAADESCEGDDDDNVLVENRPVKDGDSVRARLGTSVVKTGHVTGSMLKDTSASKINARGRSKHADSPHQKTAAVVFEAPDPDLTQEFIKPMPTKSRLGKERPYKFQASVRKHHLREQLPATKESCCSKYYELDGNGDHHCQHVGRHRELNAPVTDTPDDFWDLSFPSSETCKEKGYVREESDLVPLRKRRKVKSSLTTDSVL